MLMFLAGVYFAVAVMTFVAVGFGVCLGGKDEDLWKPFVYAPLWPVIFYFWWVDGA